MPKVQPEYLAHRRQEILTAAAACFSRRGFHQTSMQDICSEVGLSPGALYRYFGSKEEIIEAICHDHQDQKSELIDIIRSGGPAPEASSSGNATAGTIEVFNLLAAAFFGNLDDDAVCLNVDIWAEASRNERIHDALDQTASAVRGALGRIVQDGQAAGDINPALDPDAVARVLAAMFQGFLLQRQISPDFSVEAYVEALKSMVGGSFWTGPSGATAVSATREQIGV